MSSVPETGHKRLNQNARRVVRLLSEVIRSLHFYADAGYSGGDCRPDNLARIGSWDNPGRLSPSCPVETARSNNAAGLSACQGCPLREKRAHAVNGVGAKTAKVLFILGYPTFSAAQEHSPYAGESGRLLARMIEAMKLTPETVYVSHIVRCRPPDGGEPSNEERRHCFSIFERDLKEISPQVICTFGAFAARALLERDELLQDLRGRFYEKNGIRIMPTWHPEDLLADPDKKRPAWEDLQKVMSCLDII